MAIASALVISVLAVLPSDRLAMADRLFNRGQRSEARSEYIALKGSEGIAEDEILFRIAECDRLSGKTDSARASYSEIVEKHPNSKYAERARLQRALSVEGESGLKELKALDSDLTSAPIRAAALYRYGVAKNDADALARSAKLDPKGPYATYARFRRAVILSESSDDSIRRSAIGELMDFAFGKDRTFAEEAIYVAASRSYAIRRYGEASSLFHRYLKSFPDGKYTDAAKKIGAWSDYLNGKYTEAIALCGNEEGDDFAYLRGASAYALGDMVKATERFTDYLERYPHGNYRKSVELPLARLAFDKAEKSGDFSAAAEAARRSASLSGQSVDRLRLAWALERAGDNDGAQREYSDIARDNARTTDAAEALFRSAMIDIRAKSWAAAELKLTESISYVKDEKRRAEAFYWRAVAAMELGHQEEAAKFAATALSGGLNLDETREAKMMIADVDLSAGRLAEAKAGYAEIVRAGATERMSARKLRSVGRFLLETEVGASAIDEAVICAKALAEKSDGPEWKQAAMFLMGDAAEKSECYTAAISAYRSGFESSVRTEEASAASLALGILEVRAGEWNEAEKTLREAVKLNAKDSRRRASAYLWLARACEGKGDVKNALAYATVVTSLFDEAETVSEAKKILAAHNGEGQK